MTNKMKNVPELRFPEFIEEWEEKRLGDLYKYQQGQQIPVENQYKIQINNMKRFIRIVDVTENPKKRYIKDRKESGLINQKDLIMIRYGASAGTISMGYEGVIANNLFKFVKKQNVDNRYFYFLLKKSHFKIKSLSSQSAMPALNFNAMDTLKFSIPQYSEQQKIGSFFSKLDRQIELEEQKLEKLEEQKKGYMQKIFSQELRFKDDNGNDYPNWENEKLGDLINEVNERTTSNNQYVLLSSTKNCLLSQEEYFKKQIGSKDSTGYKILRLNQLVLSPQNLWLGNINFNQRFDIGIVSPSYRIYNLSHQFDINFAKDLLKSPRYIYEYAQASEQGASIVRRNLNLELFYSIKISLPSIEEQRKIGVFLNKLDKLIRKQYNKIEVLKQRKNGLLQRMFI
ncbi:hypothetical protein SOJ_26570 [Staphylococcus sp. OJ82]|uniref:restriction endonuclease subunit S n=1 Tax=Staphylococcus sp. OJ82 TaxID=1202667 RepID=UPI000281F32B|nr:restriction endonuclease subunit S [Staphylococcus sp. OJ82]EJX16701.1 hypothetical protein SOJ_26570 [Staphylococcus sp. OJ82]